MQRLQVSRAALTALAAGLLLVLATLAAVANNSPVELLQQSLAKLGEDIDGPRDRASAHFRQKLYRHELDTRSLRDNDFVEFLFSNQEAKDRATAKAHSDTKMRHAEVLQWAKEERQLDRDRLHGFRPVWRPHGSKFKAAGKGTQQLRLPVQHKSATRKVSAQSATGKKQSAVANSAEKHVVSQEQLQKHQVQTMKSAAKKVKQAHGLSSLKGTTVKGKSVKETKEAASRPQPKVADFAVTKADMKADKATGKHRGRHVKHDDNLKDDWVKVKDHHKIAKAHSLKDTWGLFKDDNAHVVWSSNY